MIPLRHVKSRRLKFQRSILKPFTFLQISSKYFLIPRLPDFPRQLTESDSFHPGRILRNRGIDQAKHFDRDVQTIRGTENQLAGRHNVG